MRWIKKTLTTIGLAASLAGCGAASDVVRYERGGLTYIVQHATAMSVPDMGSIQTERRADSFAEEGRLPPGFGVMGHLNEDGTTYVEGSNVPRYDAVVWIADTNGDGNPDLMHLVVNTQITTAPAIQIVGQSIHGQAIVQDVNYDGIADRRWVDSQNEDGERGPDGTYDEFDMLEGQSMQVIIDNLIWYRRQSSASPSRSLDDPAQFYIDQVER